MTWHACAPSGTLNSLSARAPVWSRWPGWAALNRLTKIQRNEHGDIPPDLANDLSAIGFRKPKRFGGLGQGPTTQVDEPKNLPFHFVQSAFLGLQTGTEQGVHDLAKFGGEPLVIDFET